MEFDQREADAAARLCAACEHEANEHGVCVFCGALKPDDPARAWEPPLRRPRMVGIAFTKRLPRKTLVRWLHEMASAARTSRVVMNDSRIVPVQAQSLGDLIEAVLIELGEDG